MINLPLMAFACMADDLGCLYFTDVQDDTHECNWDLVRADHVLLWRLLPRHHRGRRGASHAPIGKACIVFKIHPK